jgi:hypothetical protein
MPLITPLLIDISADIYFSFHFISAISLLLLSFHYAIIIFRRALFAEYAMPLILRH